MLSYKQMTRRKLILYLLLNVVVSALVVGTILYLYDRNGRSDCTSGVGADSSVTINGVPGVGIVKSEMVVLQNTGDQTVMLTGWTLRNSSGLSFEFPQLTLYPGGTVQVHTSMGDDSISDLYWNQTEPLWEQGDLVVLYDTQGLARAFYRIP